MAKAQPATHIAAFAVAPQNADRVTNSREPTVLPGKKHRSLTLFAQKNGGFAVLSPSEQHGPQISDPLASFTTAAEAVAWMAENIAQPAKDPA
jgi:hypothetical protein